MDRKIFAILLKFCVSWTMSVMLIFIIIIQLKDFNQSEKNEATTEEVERVYDILKRTYREQNSKSTG